MGDFQGAETAARRQIVIDNLRGVGYRQLMTNLARTGRRSEAAAAYDGLKDLIQAELKIEPSKESRDLMKAIRSGELEEGGPKTRRLRG